MVKILFLGTLLTAMSLASEAQSLEITPSTVQMGEIALKSKNRITLNCINRSQKPVVVRDIQTDCTCTKPTWSKAPIMPGDTLRVTVTLTPTDRGAFYKTVRFVTHPATEQTPQAVLRGKVY
ncbi:DUF1573 domain-containing protein [Millionella massiliensis]|uniref:DUF1573 domain-containing protein n=1 Tax=Millionella massiliensis TaxID=1871023 RepID=UPI0008DAE665|nr:DUF1573 domain-containing protein [Millionella massiliensis]